MQRIRTASAIFAVTLAWAGGAAAGCPGATQLEMNACAAQAATRADAALNGAYRQLSRPPELVAAQKAWISFRDAQCKYEASLHAGGSMQPLIYSSCLERVTKARTAELRQLLKDQSH